MVKMVFKINEERHFLRTDKIRLLAAKCSEP